MKFFLTCIATLLFAVTSAFAQFTADERITYFESEVVINPDATLDVTETITVNVAGQQIQRGIFRDFPTRYKDRLGNNITVGFDVIDVKRNGKAENYTLQSLSNGVRIRIGRADAILNHGPHTYTIRYQTNRQLGFFKNFDELYWNVTGNDWDFVIDRAKAIIHLPQGATITQRAAYTGPQGAQGQDFTISDITRPLRIETTRALQPGEGLTIAVAWPKGFVTEPSAADEAAYMARDNQGLSVLFLGLLVVAGYYYQAWSRYGRDPEGGAIFPR